MSERLEEIINDLPYSVRHSGELEVLIEYTRSQSVQVDKLAGKMAELNVFLQSFADEKGWGKNVVDIAIQIMEEQAERVQELEKDNNKFMKWWQYETHLNENLWKKTNAIVKRLKVWLDSTNQHPLKHWRVRDE